MKKNHKMSEALNRKLHQILHFDFEDYTPDDKNLLYRFWLGFLLGYVKNKPMENILLILADCHFNHEDYLPDDLTLKAMTPCEINGEVVYRLVFFVPQGEAFLNRYFREDDFFLILKSDGSKRSAIRKEGHHLIVFVEEEKIKNLYDYLNQSEFDKPNKLRDALVRFYSYYHSHLPLYKQYVRQKKDLKFSVIGRFDELLKEYSSYSYSMIHFWSKDLVEEGASLNYIQKQFHLEDINAQTIKKYLSYLFSLKFHTLRETVNQALNKSSIELEKVNLSLILRVEKGIYAYGICPGYSVNSFIDTGKNLFIQTKFKSRNFNNKKLKGLPIKKHKVKKRKPHKYISLGISNYTFKPDKIYIDIPVTLGGSLYQYLHSHVLDEVTYYLNKNISYEENDIFDGSFNLFRFELFSFMLRCEFDYLESGITLEDILVKQNYNFLIPFAAYVSFGKKKMAHTGILKFEHPASMESPLLSAPLSEFLSPENKKYILVDLNILTDDICSEDRTAKLSLHFKVSDKPFISSSFPWDEDEEED